MMKKFLKNCVSLIVIFSMIFSLTLTAFGENGNDSQNHYVLKSDGNPFDVSVDMSSICNEDLEVLDVQQSTEKIEELIPRNINGLTSKTNKPIEKYVTTSVVTLAAKRGSTSEEQWDNKDVFEAQIKLYYLKTGSLYNPLYANVKILNHTDPNYVIKEIYAIIGSGAKAVNEDGSRIGPKNPVYDVTYYSRDGFEVGDTISVHDYNDYYFDLNSSTNFFGARTDFTYLKGNSEYTFHINVWKGNFPGLPGPGGR